MVRNPNHNLVRDPNHKLVRDPNHILVHDPDHILVRDPNHILIRTQIIFGDFVTPDHILAHVVVHAVTNIYYRVKTHIWNSNWAGAKDRKRVCGSAQSEVRVSAQAGA